jgi:hypothetical protein
MPRRSSAVGEVVNLLCLPIAWALLPFIGCKRAPSDQVKQFNQTVEWKRLHYAHPRQNSRLAFCTTGPRTTTDG